MPLRPDVSHEHALILRGRMRTVRFGAWSSVAMAAVVVLYAVTTWGQDDRVELLFIALAILAVSVGLLRVSVARVVQGHWREPFFVTWSAVLITAVAVGIALDGGTGSPLAIGLVLPLLFATLTYPAWAKAVVLFLDLGAVVVVALVTSTGLQSSTWVLATVLAAAGIVCLWHSHDLEGQRRVLGLISRTDPLTGALNRRGFEECLQAALADARPGRRPLALVLLDLDDFKCVNDTHGHAAGDDLLQWVVRQLEGMVSASGRVGRLGGDEFAVLLEEPVERARECADQLIGLLANRTGASIGVAGYPPDGDTTESLHHAADAALYENKQGGRRLRPHARELGWAATLATCVDERMAVQHAHSRGVAELAGAIGGRLGLSEEEIGDLRLAGTLHDVGKIDVPVEVLRKSGPLTRVEFDEIVRHPAAGAEIVGRVHGMERIATWIRHSHERMDGGGYPSGLAGEDIPAASRILMVADAYDAMTSDRTYRPAISPSAAVAELRRLTNEQFDGAAVDALVAHLSQAGAFVHGLAPPPVPAVSPGRVPRTDRGQ